MKKVTGIFFIAAAILLLGSSFKPMAEDFPRLGKIEPIIKPMAEDFPRLGKINEPVLKPMAEDFPRLG
ncbi:MULTISPECIES: hypothetical protein [unclassified Exiguobacterium]|uniref:hypothetical protein n=1 Tax=unclassified Exiguobacterium TaxID=2644629 RepID=UPI001039E27B|nr:MULTISPECIES: hypothetical protein [unclassified Exiguobacterium]TCI32830.1 hypothetical protein EVJ29_15070 [Exiguobacterium sp. SH4S7]TCI42071.1 hypothetical protein EVJ31_14845 [Exiguobacterium sp. SH5S32]TCI49444.1 hypothetical protein EVJ25_14815 [Exiguobacterium sp. SH1S4]TCI59434.1 hypothetical protein EVJ21_13935 [Exiguobacterium sp. SH0S2]TCI66771.1 hypothetical protein EVJ23_14830 [Exiguobacterium sp. SH1S1]